LYENANFTPQKNSVGASQQTLKVYSTRLQSEPLRPKYKLDNALRFVKTETQKNVSCDVNFYRLKKLILNQTG